MTFPIELLTPRRRSLFLGLLLSFVDVCFEEEEEVISERLLSPLRRSSR